MFSTTDIPIGATQFREPASDIFDKAAIASLSLAAIADMTKDELIDVIRGAELPPFAVKNERLRYLNRPELERIAHLARRCCRLRGY